MFGLFIFVSAMLASVFLATTYYPFKRGVLSQTYVVDCYNDKSGCDSESSDYGECYADFGGCTYNGDNTSTAVWTDLDLIYITTWNNSSYCEGTDTSVLELPCGYCFADSNVTLYCDEVSEKYDAQTWDHVPYTPGEPHGKSIDIFFAIGFGEELYEIYEVLIYNKPDALGIFAAIQYFTEYESFGELELNSYIGDEKIRADVDGNIHDNKLVPNHCTNARARDYDFTKEQIHKKPFFMDKKSWDEYYAECDCVKKVESDDDSILYFFRDSPKEYPGGYQAGFSLLWTDDDGNDHWDTYDLVNNDDMYAALDAYKKYDVYPSSTSLVQGITFGERVSQKDKKKFEKLQKFYLKTNKDSYVGKYCDLPADSRSKSDEDHTVEIGEEETFIQDSFARMKAVSDARVNPGARLGGASGANGNSFLTRGYTARTAQAVKDDTLEAFEAFTGNMLL